SWSWLRSDPPCSCPFTTWPLCQSTVHRWLSGTILPPNASFETLLSEFKRLGIDASAHGRETTRSRVRDFCREFHGHCGDAGECDRAQLLGHDRRREQPVILVWGWQTAAAHKAQAVAGRAETGAAGRRGGVTTPAAPAA